MADLLDLATSVAGLRAGYERAASNHAGPGPDGVSLLEFARDLDAQLLSLSAELRGGTYQPQPGQRGGDPLQHPAHDRSLCGDTGP